MKFIYTPLLRENRETILENIRQAKQYLASGKLTQSDFKALVDNDPSSTRKYVGWMAKQWVTKQVTDMGELAKDIEQFDNFIQKNATKTKDIYQFKKYKDFKDELNYLNDSGAGKSKKDLESDYETIVDDDNLLIVVPHTHEASRKLGLTDFSYRVCGDGTKDSSWCTTYKTSTHFDDYYYKKNITFYYIKVRSEEIKKNLKDKYSEWEPLMVVAVSVVGADDDGELDLEDLANSDRLFAHDGSNNEMSKSKTIEYLKILDIR